jgi:ribonuclease HII
MFKYLAGIDEVGRGPLAGPVCVGICVAKANKKNPVWKIINKAQDSKKISKSKRNEWYKIALKLKKQKVINFATTFINNDVIDKKGINYAIKKAIEKTLKKVNLNPKTAQIFLDGGIYAPKHFTNQKTIIKGDAKIPIISLASIIAKVRRDKKMTQLAKLFPQYGFEENKGYGTKKHIKMLKKFGPSSIHRNSFIKGIIKI